MMRGLLASAWSLVERRAGLPRTAAAAVAIGCLLPPVATAQKGNTNLIDLVQVGLNAPGKVTPGKRFRVMDEIESQGEAASLQTVTYFYLSQDDVLDEKDLVIGGRRVPPLPPGAAHREVTSITLAPTLPSGDYYLLAVCDATKLMDERYENNNVRAIKIRMLAAPSR